MDAGSVRPDNRPVPQSAWDFVAGTLETVQRFRAVSVSV